MSDQINILQRAENVEVSPVFNTYSKVIINVDDETQVSTGTDAGRTMEISNPLFGSSTMAANLLRRLRGYQYQPFEAINALLDPAAEIGDGLNVNGIYGGIYTRDRTFGRLMAANVSAPHDEEINHEYKWESSTDRTLKREMADVRATFRIQAGLIEAKVSQTGGSNSSFGWVLNSTSHTWYSGNRQVMKVDSSGLEVTGKITATSGYIGNSTNGFTISATSMHNGMTSLNDTTHNGVYIGTDGIALGKGAFKVTSSGSLTATNITATGIKLKGTLTFLNSDGTTAGTMSAADLRLGAYRANSGYSSWNSAYSSTSAGGYCYGGASYGYNFDNMKYGGAYAYPINASSFRYQGYQMMPQTISFVDGNGNTRTFTGVLMSV